jgi:hypothetical protein
LRRLRFSGFAPGMPGRKVTTMVSPLRSVALVALSLAVALGASGCAHEAQAPEPWASLPVVVAGANAASFTLKIDDHLTLAGPEVDEVAERGNWKKRIPEALQEKLEAAGFKVVAPTEKADLVVKIQSTDVEWTGRFWETRGNVGVVLTTPPVDAPDSAAPATPPAAPVAEHPGVARASAHFVDVDFPHVAEAVAISIADQLARSAELLQWIEAHKAPEPVKAPVVDVPPPPPPKGLEASQVKPVLVSLRAAYRGCYDAVLVNNPGLSGTVALKLLIAPSGSVNGVAADASSSLNDAGLTGCLIDVTKAATFPKADGPTSIVYPIELVSGGAPEVNKGGLDAAEIHKGIRGAHEKMRACHEAGLKKDPAFAGTVKLKFNVDLKGNVPKIEALKDSSVTDPDIRKCVVEAVKGVTFPKPKKWTEVVYPIEFRP